MIQVHLEKKLTDNVDWGHEPVYGYIPRRTEEVTEIRKLATSEEV